jgi:hypothetical protein
MTRSKDSPAPSRGKGQPAPANNAAAEKQPYRAFEVSSEAKRHLEIRLRDPEPAECPSYSRLSNIRTEWRRGQAITLEYGQTREGLQMMVIIRGENLMELHQALKDWKVDWIAEFDPEEHDMPTDESMPFIKSITIHTKRPEQPPPADKRH